MDQLENKIVMLYRALQCIQWKMHKLMFALLVVPTFIACGFIDSYWHFLFLLLWSLVCFFVPIEFCNQTKIKLWRMMDWCLGCDGL